MVVCLWLCVCGCVCGYVFEVLCLRVCLWLCVCDCGCECYAYLNCLTREYGTDVPPGIAIPPVYPNAFAHESIFADGQVARFCTRDLRGASRQHRRSLASACGHFFWASRPLVLAGVGTSSADRPFDEALELGLRHGVRTRARGVKSGQTR